MRSLTIGATVILVSGVCTVQALGAVYGVGQNRDSNPNPDTFLFSFDENLTSSPTPNPVSPIGTANVSGSNIFVDAIAMDAQRRLYGFEYTGAGTTAQLVRIDTSTAAAVRIGSAITASVSAAGFDLPGNLWALNVTSNRTTSGPTVTSTGAAELLRVDPGSGAVLQTLTLSVPGLHGNFAGMLWSQSGDIAVDRNGTMWMGVDYFDTAAGGLRSGVFTINLFTGQIGNLLRTHIGTRNVMGLTFAKGSADDPGTALPVNELQDGYWFEASGTEDVHRVRVDNTLSAYGPHVLNINGSYGVTALERGDLAAAMPEPSGLLLIVGGLPLILLRRR